MGKTYVHVHDVLPKSDLVRDVKSYQLTVDQPEVTASRFFGETAAVSSRFNVLEVFAKDRNPTTHLEQALSFRPV